MTRKIVKHLRKLYVNKEFHKDCPCLQSSIIHILSFFFSKPSVGQHFIRSTVVASATTHRIQTLHRDTQLQLHPRSRTCLPLSDVFCRCISTGACCSSFCCILSSIDPGVFRRRMSDGVVSTTRLPAAWNALPRQLTANYNSLRFVSAVIDE